MPVEVWKDVVGFEGLYEVSDAGRVRSLDRVIRTSNGQERKYRGRGIWLQTSKRGYKKVVMKNAGKSRQEWVHVLVAEAFIGSRPQGLDVCHENGSPSDNRPGNLRYDTRSNNNKDTRKHGHPQAKVVIRSDGKTYPSTGAAGDDGFSATGVGRVCRGERKSHGGFGWEYVA